MQSRRCNRETEQIGICETVQVQVQRGRVWYRCDVGKEEVRRGRQELVHIDEESVEPCTSGGSARIAFNGK
jgi:hypothetical protein